MKKVLIVSSSLRGGSNSERLAKAFEEGAKAAGHDVQFLSLKNKNLQFCRGCLACQRTGACAIRDDMAEMLPLVAQAEAICFATPIYYYEMSGQMKTFLDRVNPLYGADTAFKDIYLLTTCADGDEGAMERAEHGLGGWIDCFDGVALKGSLCGVGVNDANEMANRADLLQRAYEMGKRV